MKKIFLIAFFTIFSLQNCFADQLQMVTLQQATKAVALIKKQKTVVLFCGCCDNVPKEIIEVTGAYFKSANYKNEAGVSQYYVILLGKNSQTNEAVKKEVDLAYVYIKNGASSITVGKFLNYKCDPCVESIDWYSNPSKNNSRFETQMSKAVGDLNYDKLNDVVFVMADTIKGDYQIQIYLNDGKGKLQLKTSSITAISDKFNNEDRVVFRTVEIDKSLLKINYAHYNHNDEGTDTYIFKYELGQFILTNITQNVNGNTVDMNLKTKTVEIKEYKEKVLYKKSRNFTLSNIPTIENYDNSNFKVNQ